MSARFRHASLAFVALFVLAALLPGVAGGAAAAPEVALQPVSARAWGFEHEALDLPTRLAEATLHPGSADASSALALLQAQPISGMPLRLVGVRSEAMAVGSAALASVRVAKVDLEGVLSLEGLVVELTRDPEGRIHSTGTFSRGSLMGTPLPPAAIAPGTTIPTPYGRVVFFEPETTDEGVSLTALTLAPEGAPPTRVAHAFVAHEAVPLPPTGRGLASGRAGIDLPSASLGHAQTLARAPGNAAADFSARMLALPGGSAQLLVSRAVSTVDAEGARTTTHVRLEGVDLLGGAVTIAALGGDATMLASLAGASTTSLSRLVGLRVHGQEVTRTGEEPIPIPHPTDPGRTLATLHLFDAISLVETEEDASHNRAESNVDLVRLALEEEFVEGGVTLPSGTILRIGRMAGHAEFVRSASLRVLVEVTNAYGGTLAPEDVELRLGGLAIAAGETRALHAGAHQVAAEAPDGYELAFASDCDATGGVSLAWGQRKTCIVRLADAPAHLTLLVDVQNAYGGTLGPQDFPPTLDGSPVAWSERLLLPAGSYVAAVPDAHGYAVAFGPGCARDDPIPLRLGEDATCHVVIRDLPAHLTLLPRVENRYGGTLAPADVRMTLDDEPADAGTPIPLSAGSYRAGGSAHPGYEGSFGEGCDAQGGVSLALAEEKTCVLTLRDTPATLTIRTRVVNDDGRGQSAPEDFQTCVTGTFADGVVETRCAPGAPTWSLPLGAGGYRVTQTGPGGYATTTSLSCAGDAEMGAPVTCDIVHDDRGITRSMGFWQTHTDLTRSVLAAHFPDGMAVGAPARKHVGDAPKLFGAWYASVSKTTTGAARAEVDQARMQLVQQLVAAKLNCAAFGCSDGARARIADADAAYSGTDAAAMRALALQLAAGNVEWHTEPLPAGMQASSTPRASSSLADRAFWNAP